MSLPDIMQWAESTRKSGTLTIRQSGISKVFYIQDGKLIFISSQKQGERFGEFFIKDGHIDRKRLETALRESQRLSVPFTGYLISEGLIEQNVLEQMIERLAKIAFADSLSWEDGSFEFIDAIPAVIVNGPIKLHTSFVILESARDYDESHRDQTVDARAIVAKLADQIAQGNFDIPPTPDIMRKLNDALHRDDTSIQDVVTIIVSDQILTAKILKVVNSAFYSPTSKIGSIQQALVFMGLKSVVSIATVHALSGFGSGASAEQIKDVLRHSLLCAYIAKKLAALLRMDPEEAFSCGLLHDIGKTVLLNMTSTMAIPDEDKRAMIVDFHEGVGHFVTGKWNFSEVLRMSAKFHHHPEDAPAHQQVVETVYLADLIANGREIQNSLPASYQRIDAGALDGIAAELDSIRETVSAVI